MVILTNFTYSGGSTRVPHWGLHLHFPDYLWHWAPFHMYIDIFEISLCEVIFQVSDYFPLCLNQVMSFLWICRNSLHILNKSPLSVLWVAIIFSHTVGHHLTLSVFKRTQCILILKYINLLNFLYISDFYIPYKKSFPVSKLWKYSPILSFTSFTVFPFKIRFKCIWNEFCV